MMDPTALVDMMAGGMQPQLQGIREVWATVKQLVPEVKVRKDGETAWVTITSSAEPIEQLEIDNRVFCWQIGTQLILVKKRDRSLSIWDTPLLPPTANFNDYRTPGQWYCPSSADVATMTNKPPNNQAGSLVVLEASGVIQYWHEYNVNATDGNVWRRRWYEATNSWSAWALYAGPGMMQTGSNANGNWAWFANTGLTFCWMEAVRTDISMSNAYGPLYQGTWRWDYPRSFNNGSAYPVVSVGQFKYDTGASWGTCSETYQSYAIIRGIDVVSRSAGANVLIKLSAIGYSW